MKRTIINNLLSILLVVALLVTTVYAWWMEYDSVTNVNIVTAKMESEIVLYKGIDFNYDGLLDLDSEGDEMFTTKLTSDCFDFRNVDVNGNVTAHNVIPTEIHTWKIVVTNKGNAVGLVNMKLVVQDEELKNVFKYFALTVDGERYYLNDVFNKGIVNIYSGKDEIRPNESREFIIQFELLDYSELEGLEYTNISLEEYQEIQGKSLLISNEKQNKFLDVILSTIN